MMRAAAKRHPRKGMGNVGETGKRRGRLIVGLVLLASIWGVAGGRELAQRAMAPKPDKPATVGFTARDREPTDDEVRAMVDEVTSQVLGPKGLAAIISPGDKVVIKVNIVDPSAGASGDKGRGIITDPRIVRHVAEKVRAIIGTGGTADLKVVDATFDHSPDPSRKGNAHSFYWAHLERT
ncbi:unnamed protein product, partial [marine sediment metagenome]